MKTLTRIDNVAEIMPEEIPSLDLLQVIHDDNAAVAELFFQFTQAEDDDEKQEIFEAISTGLAAHAQLVEEVLFPAVIDSAEEEDEEDAEKLVAVSEAGNYVAALLLDELSSTNQDDEYFDAKMTILCELTKKQVKREEKEMFDKLRAAEVDLDQLGEQALELKSQIEENNENAKSKSKAKTRSSTKSKAPAKGKAPAKVKALGKSNTKVSAKAGGKKASGKPSISRTNASTKTSAKSPASKKRSR